MSRVNSVLPRMTVLAVIFGIFLLMPSLSAAPATDWDLYSDTWAATDALGRQLPMGDAVRPPQKDKYVGMFYFVWHGNHGMPGPYDISKLLEANPTNPAYGAPGAFHWWGQPEVGYFRADDPWVLRRNLSMLEDAGVDVLIIDVTNAFTYPETVRALFETARAMRSEGNHTPQIAFIVHSRGGFTVQQLWDEVYSKNLYPELWFRWQGKPLLLGDRDAKTDDGKPIPDEIKNFFTWRYSWAWEPGQDKWQWIDKYPQRPGWHDDPGLPEELPVSVASHPVNNIGRSFHDGKEPPLDEHRIAPTYTQGLHFAEQWQQALKIDPSFVFVTGWNEWVAQRFVVDGATGPGFLGKTTKKGETFFVDAYNAEFSRDIDPMQGGYMDNYYYQLMADVRRFKGARRLPVASPPQTITLDGKFDEWRNVTPEYRDTIGDTLHRDWNGWGNLHYTNNTGRNDIVSSKVAYDARNIYFYVDTRDNLTPATDPSWMLLFIDADHSSATGWQGYDYMVNSTVLDANHTTLKRVPRSGNDWQWVADVPYHAAGNKLVISIPRALLGQTGSQVAFDFHWADNIRQNHDITEFFQNGDNAPNRRANYRYESGSLNRIR